MTRKLIVTILVAIACFHASAQEGQPEQDVYKFEFEQVRSTGGNDTNPFYSGFVLQTPKSRVRMNASIGTLGLLPVTAAVMIPQKGLWDAPGHIFETVRGLPTGQRNTVAGAVSASGLVTLSLGLNLTTSVDRKKPKPADPVAEAEKSPGFEMLRQEFGAQVARDIVFKRMVEGWSFKMIAQKYFKEPLRSKAVKMANEEYEGLSADKSAFGNSIADQEAIIDARVGQIVMLRLALEKQTEDEVKAALNETIMYLRTEHKGKAPAAGGEGGQTAEATTH